ncbi:MAG: peptidoglycan DD-metalloendopeptidase family protein [Chitinispirillales bacterium]|jgi:murein DD-endopeptidase MepM/ murein hydrolase activator NlpD|nr:peptidoglycan DD-metalloendopeptidase family protein [Chitinispirillales bacterium]
MSVLTAAPAPSAQPQLALNVAPAPAPALGGEGVGISSVPSADSIAEAQYREEEGQDFNSLFEDAGEMAIDTSFGWSNNRINSGRFDYKMLGAADTIKIPLVDSAQNKRYAHPFSNYVTSQFGPRRFLWHYGVDVKLQQGDTVKCALDGIVRVIQYDRRGYGNVVVVRHHNGLETVYGHLYKVTVRPNQRLRAAEAVGLGGNTGRSTGAHLHFETRYFGEPFNPSHIIDFDSYALKSDTLVLTRGDFEYLTELRKTVYHTVRRGDNLGSVSRRYGTTVNKLCRLNGITSKTALRVGKRLVVRSGKEAEEQVTKSVAVAQEQGASALLPSGAQATVDEAMNRRSPEFRILNSK